MAQRTSEFKAYSVPLEHALQGKRGQGATEPNLHKSQRMHKNCSQTNSSSQIPGKGKSSTC
eukprot:2563886-Amphidinium_carterae.1